jgi:hypothetical protein
MRERDAAQADQLIRALCEVRHEMIRQLRWLEDSQLEAAALRRDINEAQIQINRLQRRYGQSQSVEVVAQDLSESAGFGRVGQPRRKR